LDKCWLAYHGVTIDPQGHVSMCCVDDGLEWDPKGNRKKRFYNLTKLEEVDDLQEWFERTYPKKVWNENPEEFFPCMTCYNPKDTAATTLKDIMSNHKWTQDESNPKVKYLEYTSSNICNQMCVMCSGRYSSKWLDYDTEFGHTVREGLVRLSDESIEKLKRVVPTLEECQIKGGEPLSDQKNIEFMEYVAEVNPDCKITVVSNFQGLLQRHIEIFKKVNSNITVSIDGVGSVFNWIRGGDFDKVVSNMQRYYDETGKQVDITITVSVYNFFNLEEIIKYFHDKEYVKYINCHNVVYWPTWASPRILPPEVLEENLMEHMKLPNQYKNTGWGDYFSLDGFDQEEGEDRRKLFKLFTNKMNLIRGIDIFDHVPQLRDL
jgi:molybdenum cofactor biosynthesis enzyme MoaA